MFTALQQAARGNNTSEVHEAEVTALRAEIAFLRSKVDQLQSGAEAAPPTELVPDNNTTGDEKGSPLDTKLGEDVLCAPVRQLRWHSAELVDVGHDHDHPDAKVHMRHITDPGSIDSLDCYHYNMAAGQFNRLFDPSGRRGPGGRRSRGGALRVTAVDVYESPLTRMRYEQTRAAFAAAGKPAEEVWVFHGTSESAIAPIMATGFEVGGEAVAMRNGQSHGAGVYCAEGPNTPISYSKHGQQVILARGLLGVAAEDVPGRGARGRGGGNHSTSGVGGGASCTAPAISIWSNRPVVASINTALGAVRAAVGWGRRGSRGGSTGGTGSTGGEGKAEAGNPLYFKGQVVESRYRGGRRVYPGTITHVNSPPLNPSSSSSSSSSLSSLLASGFTYNIRYVDGDVEERVDEGCIREATSRDSWRPVVGEDWIVFKDGAQLLPSYVVHFEEDHRFKMSEDEEAPEFGGIYGAYSAGGPLCPVGGGGGRSSTGTSVGSSLGGSSSSSSSSSSYRSDAAVCAGARASLSDKSSSTTGKAGTAGPRLSFTRAAVRKELWIHGGEMTAKALMRQFRRHLSDPLTKVANRETFKGWISDLTEVRVDHATGTKTLVLLKASASTAKHSTAKHSSIAAGTEAAARTPTPAKGHMPKDTQILPPPMTPWSCSGCTFRNDAGDGTCSLCDSPHDSWSCHVCSEPNDPDRVRCKQCTVYREGVIATATSIDAGGAETKTKTGDANDAGLSWATPSTMSRIAALSSTPSSHTAPPITETLTSLELDTLLSDDDWVSTSMSWASPTTLSRVDALSPSVGGGGGAGAGGRGSGGGGGSGGGNNDGSISITAALQQAALL